MTLIDELHELYKQDFDFKRYVDHWCQKHNINIYEAFQTSIVKEYAKWLKENKK